MHTLLARPHEAVTDLGLAAAFPRLQPQAARVLSQLYSRCAAITLALRGKPHRLEWRMPAATLAEHDSFRFKLGAHIGHVGIDVPALAMLLGERRSELLPRELRYVLWADALHSIADAVESRTRLRLEWAPADDPAERCRPDPHRAAFFVFTPAEGGGDCRGFLQFEDSSALDLLPPPWPARKEAAAIDALDALRLPLPFLLGTTGISLKEVRGVRPGDIISIEDWGTAGTALRVSARFGGSSGRELMGLAEGSRITIHQTRDHAMNREPIGASPLPDDDDGQLPLDRLDALEVNLRFEVGDLSLSLGELRSIRAGHVFELAQPLNRSAVRILAHGNVLGKGHLVAVGDRLGVRVSEFAPSEL